MLRNLNARSPKEPDSVARTLNVDITILLIHTWYDEERNCSTTSNAMHIATSFVLALDPCVVHSFWSIHCQCQCVLVATWWVMWHHSLLINSNSLCIIYNPKTCALESFTERLTGKHTNFICWNKEWWRHLHNHLACVNDTLGAHKLIIMNLICKFKLYRFWIIRLKISGTWCDYLQWYSWLTLGLYQEPSNKGEFQKQSRHQTTCQLECQIAIKFERRASVRVFNIFLRPARALRISSACSRNRTGCVRGSN